MKKNYLKIFAFIFFLAANDYYMAQCASVQTGGSSSNMFTLIRNGTSSIAANKALNSIVFIHRNDAGLFGGNSGNLRFDYSANGGTSWTTNQGVLNNLNTNLARYPNIAIYNPVANTNTANAYLSYMAPTIDATLSTWNGEVTGVSQFNATGTTETYNQNGIGTTWQANSLVNGAPGVFWAIDPLGTTGFNIYRGVWNSLTSDISWSINYVCTPTFSYFPLLTEVDYNIAFDPTGMIGYFCFASHVSGGPSQTALYPTLYKTTNGGSSWTGPITVDLTQFSCITSNTVSPNVPSMNVGSDLVVDANGNPHILTTLGNATNYVFNYGLWHHMYDITLKSGLWVAYDLGNVNGAPNIFGTSPNIATQWQAPQAARSADGSKVFFTWTDNTGYTLGAVNSSPDLIGKAYNVTNDTWTQTKNFTSCNVTTAGKILFPHIAPEVLEPTTSSYKVAAVYGEPSVTNDMLVAATFKFLDNITFAASEFTATVPPATVTIQQAPLVVICPNASVNINITGGAGQAIWNTGATTTSLSVTSGTATSYSVVAQVGCNVGTATIAVTNLTVNPTIPSTGICPGSAANFLVTGNALGYTWTPGNATGTNVTLNPTASTITLTSLGSSSCLSTQTLSINILPPPTITIAGNSTICASTVLSLTASGAQTYVWDNNTTSATFTDTPLINMNYTVIGTAANTCTNTQTFSVVVKPSPTITAASNPTAICIGQTVALTSSGAISYSWNAVASSNNITETPTSSSVYTVTGAGVNLCETSKTVSVIVYALPNLTITPAKNLFCKGEKIKLTASGASSYTWVSPGIISSTLQVSPLNNTTYTVLGTSTENCENTQTFALVVSPCTGIGEFEKNNLQLSIYPNPNSGSFNVKSEINLHLTLVNEIGQVVSVFSLDENNSHEFTIKELSAGLYFVMGEKDGTPIHQKIVVTR